MLLIPQVVIIFSPHSLIERGYPMEFQYLQLIDNLDGESNIQLPSNNSINNSFSAKTRINLFPNLAIDFDWSTSISNRSTKTITVTPEGEYSSVLSESGGYNSSVWVFGDGYKDLLKRQIQTAVEDINEGSTILSDTTGNGDGKFVLNRNTLEEEFRKAYLGSNVSGRGNKGLFIFPY